MSLVHVLLSITVIVFVWLLSKWLPHYLRPVPIPKIYVQPSFHSPLKYWVLRALLLLRKITNSRRRKSGQASSNGAGYGVASRNSPEDMEKVQDLPADMPEAVDAVYINGGNSEGVFMVAATARRQNDVVQTVLYLRIPSIGLLELPSLPDTWITDTASQSAYSGGGLSLTPLKAMDTWAVKFSGKMRISESGKLLYVTFDLLWKATSKYIDFDTDLSPHAQADAISRESWSREYFRTLKSAHQTHYEQFGEVSGDVHVEGHSNIKIQIQGVRDHSYGNVRNWRYFHRYAINYAYLEDGSALCVGVICMPISLSRLVIGYVCHPDGSMDPVSQTDFEFHNHGEDGRPPQNLQLNFTAGKKTYQLECSVQQAPVFYMGPDWEAKIHERFCTYTVNGVSGWGISEWDYRNYDGKEVEMARLLD